MDSLELTYRRTEETAGARWQPLPGTFASAVDNGLVVHDLFHPLPASQGSLADELARLGAEYYLHHEGAGRLQLLDKKAAALPPSGLNVLARSAAEVVGRVFALRQPEPGELMLGHSGALADCPTAERVFAAAERSATAGLERLVWGAEGDAELMAAKNAFCAPGVVASWLRHGWQAARLRYPDQARARAAWTQAQELLHELGKAARPDTVLVARRDGYAATFSVAA